MKNDDIEMCVSFNASVTVEANSKSEAEALAREKVKANPFEYCDDIHIEETTYSGIERGWR